MKACALSISTSNLLRHSEDLSNAVWTPVRSSVDPNKGRAADGELIGDKLICDGTTDPQILQTYDTGVLVDNRTFNFSVWLWTGASMIPVTASSIYIYNTGVTSVGTASTAAMDDFAERFSVEHTFSAGAGGTAVTCRIDLKNIPIAGDYQYAVRAQLTETSYLMPYKTTTDSIIDEGVTGFLEFDPEYDYKLGMRKIEDTHRAKSGALYTYKWGDHKRVEFTIRNITHEHKSLYNEWWRYNRLLTFHNNLTGENWPCRIVNKSEPVNQVEMPYAHRYKGKFVLEAY